MATRDESEITMAEILIEMAEADAAEGAPASGHCPSRGRGPYTYTTILPDGRRTTETLRADGSVVSPGDPAVLDEAGRRAFWHMHGLPCPDLPLGPETGAETTTTTKGGTR